MLPGRVLEALRGFTLFSTLSEQESLENCNGMNNLYLVTPDSGVTPGTTSFQCLTLPF